MTNEEAYEILTSDYFIAFDGKWIKQENKKTEFFCSECGRMIDTKPFTRTDNFPFCHCGAEMEADI